MQIDHVVALSDAWQKGAQKLAKSVRTELANDPYNLLAVQGRANQQKSDGDAATWLPSNKGFRCEYVARQIGVKHKYSLWVTAAEKSAMERVLASCPAQTVPDYAGVRATSAQQSQQNDTQTSQEQAQQQQAIEDAAAAAAQAQQQAQQQSSGSDVYYQNCTAAREAGAAQPTRASRAIERHLTETRTASPASSGHNRRLAGPAPSSHMECSRRMLPYGSLYIDGIFPHEAIRTPHGPVTAWARTVCCGLQHRKKHL